jgi:galactose mutarotase-like enzyme
MRAATNYEVAESLDGFRIYELKEASTDSSVKICPERGGIVIGCRLRGEELFYMDRATFLDPNANIRGGNPVLFPICGQLVGGQYEWEGRTYAMKNHGVARVLPWDVIGTNAEGSASITLSLHSNNMTLEAFPFDFELRFTYRLEDGKLSIEQTYANLSDRPMPMVAGFHPYFALPGDGSDKNLICETDATLLLDYNDGVRKPFDGSLDLGVRVESAALLDARKPEIAFPLGDRVTVRLTYSELFKYIVLWSVKDKPFVCVEPWTALNEALNSKEDLLTIAPGQSLALQLHLACEIRS